MMSLLAISDRRLALVAEYGHAGTIQRRTIHGPNADADDPYVQFEGPEIGCTGTRFLHADPRGSIVALADCWGNNQAINAYDEFGIPDTATGNDIATKGRFRYTGQAWIPELGMYYYKARIYSPTLGRFLQTDPIGYEDQFNLYAYVANDPINGIDPTGLDTCSPNPLSETEAICLPTEDNEILVVGDREKVVPDKPDRGFLGDLREMGRIFQKVKENIDRDREERRAAGLSVPNGCGAEGGVKGLPFIACDAHDICYGTLGASKDKCDTDFLNGMIAESFGPGSNGLITAFAYYGAVRSPAGDAAYRAAQKAAAGK